MYLFDSKWEDAGDGTVQTSRPLAATPIMIIRFLEINVVAMAMDIGYLVMGQLILFFVENNTVETILGSFNVIIITFHILRDIQ